MYFLYSQKFVNYYLLINYRARGSVTATKVQCPRDVTFIPNTDYLVQIIGIFGLTYGENHNEYRTQQNKTFV